MYSVEDAVGPTLQTAFLFAVLILRSSFGKPERWCKLNLLFFELSQELFTTFIGILRRGRGRSRWSKECLLLLLGIFQTNELIKFKVFLENGSI